MAAWVVLEARQGRLRRTGASGRDRGSYLLLLGCVAAAWVVTGLAAAHDRGAVIGGQPAPFVAGLVLAWVGIVLRGWAFRTLGRYFTFRVQTSADQPVISTGPYRVLRHPGYTGIELVLVGMGLLYGTWPGVVVMVVVPMLGLVNRIRVEERALQSDLGAAYRTYAASRKRMIPFVW